MAIFEKAPQTKVKLDDTEKLICTLENAQNIDKHTEYILQVQNGPTKDDKWLVSRRYKEFAALHAQLQQSNITLCLPPKKLIGNMQPSFIAERQIALQNYINEVLKHNILALSYPVRKFLDPSNYPSTLADLALQTVSIALRGDGLYDLQGPASDIGWRIRKHYFVVTERSSSTSHMLTWINFGPDRCLSDKDLHTALKCLQHISHPHIDQILAYHNLEKGVYIVRKIHPNGSVRDMLYGTDYNKSYFSKYGNPEIKKPFTVGQIAHYGLHILRAMKFLHEKGLPHGHIHPGNIAIVNQTAVLLEVENSLLGVASLYRPFIIQHKRLNTLEEVDVHCFGRTLYEMAFAEPLNEAYCDNIPDGISVELRSVLSLCLSSSSCKHGMPSIQQLLQHPLFTNMYNGQLDVKQSLKFPNGLKEELRRTVAMIENRLKTDQKLYHAARREVRIREILSSDEEMRKQKKKAKKRDSVWKSTSSLAETVRSHSVSTTSSPTPPIISTEIVSNGNSSLSTSAPSTSPATDNRSALLSAICSFDKTRLSNVNSR